MQLCARSRRSRAEQPANTPANASAPSTPIQFSERSRNLRFGHFPSTGERCLAPSAEMWLSHRSNTWRVRQVCNVVLRLSKPFARRWVRRKLRIVRLEVTFKSSDKPGTLPNATIDVRNATINVRFSQHICVSNPNASVFAKHGAVVNINGCQPTAIDVIHAQVQLLQPVRTCVSAEHAERMRWTIGEGYLQFFRALNRIAGTASISVPDIEERA
eukprot:1671735-Rhodomonas_salina.2